MRFPVAMAAVAALLLALPSGAGLPGFALPLPWQGGEPGAPRLSPQASAGALALCGQSPYLELWQAGLPLPPSPGEVEALPDRQRAAGQLAMKRVLLARSLRARVERNRISLANWQACAREARAWGAPDLFAELLELRASDALSRPERYLVEQALDHMLELYRVDERELRYFVASRSLPSAFPEGGADWFPLALLCNVEPPAGVDAASVRAHDLALLAALGELALLYRSVQDAASADAAAAAMPDLLARFRSASRALGYAPDELRQRVRARYASLAGTVENSWLTQRRRVAEADYFGSARLRALDFFMD